MNRKYIFLGSSYDLFLSPKHPKHLRIDSSRNTWYTQGNSGIAT